MVILHTVRTSMPPRTNQDQRTITQPDSSYWLMTLLHPKPLFIYFVIELFHLECFCPTHPSSVRLQYGTLHISVTLCYYCIEPHCFATLFICVYFFKDPWDYIMLYSLNFPRLHCICSQDSLLNYGTALLAFDVFDLTLVHHEGSIFGFLIFQ